MARVVSVRQSSGGYQVRGSGDEVLRSWSVLINFKLFFSNSAI